MALFKLTYIVERALHPECGSIFSHNTIRIPSPNRENCAFLDDHDLIKLIRMQQVEQFYMNFLANTNI